MFRPFLCLAAVMSLSACGLTGQVAGPGTSPANPSAPATPPLAATTIDDQAISGLFLALDTTASAIDLAIAAGKITPGTPKALRIEKYLQATRAALNAGSLAQRRGELGQYIGALNAAREGFQAVRDALKEQ
jgi:predicted small lipoprotein YifL